MNDELDFTTCASGAVPKLAEFNSSVARCAETGTVAGLLLQLCDEPAPATGRAGRTRNGIDATAVERYARRLQFRHRRRQLTGNTVVRVFIFIAALATPLDDVTLLEALDDARVKHVQVDCTVQLDSSAMAGG